jgi:hypothetical protein
MSVINGATNTAPTPVAGTAVTIKDTIHAEVRLLSALIGSR